MSNDSTAVDFGINLLEEEIDDVIFRTLWPDSLPSSSVHTWPIR